ncbi:MAG: large conductance mechanosensitive channel protein MscL [Acidobacteriota bacterium]|nr:large conductance mechanosensitive channel protein MscL [Acidobacteriota bacterium]
MLKDFKAFAMRGPVLDMAIGIILGVAFGQIITSLVSDIIMPPIGLLLGHVDFNNFFANISGKHYETLADAKKAGAAVIAYGHFINTIIDFIIVAFCMFLIVKWFSSMKKPEPPAAPTTKDCPYCLSTVPLKATRCPHCTSQLASA